MSVFQYVSDNWDQIGPQILTHLEIVGECIAITSAVGLGLGIAAARSEPLSTIILAVTSTILTVPSFALFGLLSIWFGLANPPVIIGLILYGLLPVTRNTRAGIKTVDPAVVESARGMGMNPRQVLLKVELPLAVPVVLGGIRQATVMIVAIATVGATVGVDDLGQTILSAIGRGSGQLDAVLAGILPVAAIGILADLILAGIQRAPFARTRLGGGDMITFDQSRQALRELCRRRPSLARDQIGGDGHPGRPLRLRQDHILEDDQPAGRADRRVRSASTIATRAPMTSTTCVARSAT